MLELLSSKGREAARVRRAAKTLTQRYAQPEARAAAADRLVATGTPEAIYQLARRFTMTAGNLEQDDQEKRWVRDLLVEFGAPAAEPLRRFLRGHDEVTWAMEALRALIPDSELAEFLFSVLGDGDPVTIRGPKAAQIIDFVSGLPVPGVGEGLVRCLGSADDTVRLAVVRALREARDEATREALLLALVAEEEDSLRVRIEIAGLFADFGWEIRGRRPAVEKVLPDGFRITSKGRIVKV